MTIPALPTAPAPTDTPSEFNSKAFTFLAALDPWGDAADALAVQMAADAVATAADAVATAADAITASNAADTATTQAGIAASEASAAQGSATSAAASYDAFDDRYLGSKASDPTLDNDGNALLTGALYWNSSANEMRVYNGSNWAASYLPAAGYATLTGTQTLTNKTIDAATNTLTGVVTLTGAETLTNKTIDAATNTLTGVATLTGSQTLTNKTLTAPTATGAILNDGYTEEVFAVTGTTPALSPTNGSIQTWTLSGNSTPTQGTWANGQSITLMIDDGSAFTVTWTSLGVVWKTNGGAAPTLQTTGVTVIQLWEVGNVIYGARVGDA